MSVLVTGGAGYIGSHTIAALLEKGEKVVAYDSLATGHRQAVIGCPLIVGDIRDGETLQRVIDEYEVDSVIHFAAFSLVGVSMADPMLYYQNNVAGTLALADAMLKRGVKRLVFSSTASVYGIPASCPVSEDMPTEPINVYGRTKLVLERAFRDFDAAYGFRSISLRYFNAAGAHESLPIGEAHEPETHIIANCMRSLLTPGGVFTLFGDDYPTPDGTCVRDYIHVMDLADAHIKALEALRGGHGTDSFNLGNGEGFSNLDIVKAVEAETGRKLNISMDKRRPGDPAILVASADKARRELGWRPARPELSKMIASAWRWHSQHPGGFSES